MEDLIDKAKTIMVSRGADSNLADAISRSFNPLDFAPTWRTIKEMFEIAPNQGRSGYRSIAFTCLLAGQTQNASDYLENGYTLGESPENDDITKLLDNIDEVRRVIGESMRDFDAARIELGKPSLETYLKEH